MTQGTNLLGLFSNYRHLYKEPERVDTLNPSDRLRRRIELEIARVAAIEGSNRSLSPANQLHLRLLNDFQAERQRAELVAKRAHARVKSDPSPGNVRDHKRAISRLFNLSQRVERLRKGLYSVQAVNGLRSQQGQRHSKQGAAKPSGGDRRYFSFDPNKQTNIYGSEAAVRFVQTEAGLRPFFKLASLALPCIQREVRREVMFAYRKAGKGHRGRRRFSPTSMIGC